MKRQTGFSFIELVVTLFLAALLTMAAVPSMYYMLMNNRITTKTNQFVSAINYARSLSVANPTETVVIEAHTAGEKWGDGWRIRVDDDSITNPENEPTTKQVEFDDNSITIDVSNSIKQIRYRRGFLDAATSRSIIKLNICLKDWEAGDPLGRQLEISPVGRASVSCTSYSCKSNACEM